MKEDLNEIEEIVAELNEQIYDKLEFWDEHYLAFLDIHTDTYCIVIRFLDISIWDSKDGERRYDDDKDDYEPLKSFLIKKVNYYIRILSRLKLEDKC